jgi:hypothetical protein
MKYPIPLAIAAALLALPFSVRAETDMQAASAAQDINATDSAQAEAMRMVPAQGALVTEIDAKKDSPGKEFQVRLVKTVRLENGTELRSGTILVGQVAQDDMQMAGNSKLALRITEARPKSGDVVPIKAMIAGLVGPGTSDLGGHTVMPGEQDNNTWTNKTLKIDQIDAISGADLHSNVASMNSGVLVSTKGDVKLKKGSEIELAIASASDSNSSGMNRTSGRK